MLQRIRVAAALMVALGVSIGPAYGQESRAETLERQRAEKASNLQPYQPGKLEKAMLWYEDFNPLTKIAPRNGFFVEYGYSQKPVGSGIGLGAGWRHDLFDRRARVELEGGISYRNYRLLRADFSLPYLADERLEIGVAATDHHNPQEDFFGLGPESVVDNRVSFLADHRNIQGRLVARPVRWFEGALRVGRLNTSLGPGTDARYPSIEALFGDDTAPGLVAEPDYTYTELAAAVDYRDQPGNARAGGYYGLRWRRSSDTDLERYSFATLDAHVQHFFPIFDKKRVFAVQARLISANPDEDHQVPFFFKPTVGGSTTLRSYRDYRFRDDNVFYLNAEYRWEAFSGLDMALFTDWGTVAPEIDRLSLSNLKKGYGIGFRFNTFKSVWLRMDIGFGGTEGTRYFFKFSTAY